jgi:MFS family permease
MSASLNQEIRKQLRHNVIMNLLDGGFFGLALGFSSFSAFIPIFVNRLTNSALLIGLVPALYNVGWQFPQLFTAGWTARLRRFKTTVIVLTVLERIPFFGLALVAWFLPIIGKQSALIITFLLLTWQGLGGGLTANPWTSMISKIIPPEYRGTFFGAQSSAANAFMSVGSILAGFLLEKISDRYNFSLLFLLTGIIMVISWFFLASTHEPIDYAKVVCDTKQPFWKGSRTILKRDSNFRWFLVARLLSQFASMGFAFYIIYAVNHFAMDEFTAGITSATLTGAAILANPLMGWAGDRWGHKRLMLLGIFSATVSSLLAWQANSLSWFFIIMILTGIANVSIWTIALTITVEFGSEEERPLYIGLSNTLVAPATILAPLIGGWIADRHGYPTMFFFTALAGLLALIVIILFFKEPKPRFNHLNFEELDIEI